MPRPSAPAPAAADRARAGRPLSAREFERTLAPLFESAEPDATIAVAVSGGADSLALALLADGWARRHRRKLVALTVDHGLRPESKQEAAQVHRWLTGRGIAHHCLRWRGPKPAANLQAAARQARYGLLRRWCRRHGVRQLLLAHQLEDQAETFLIRAGRGSGVDGLAGIAPVSEGFGMTLIRPLLGVPRVRLEATLRAAGQPWIDDPSNRDPRFLRSRVRAALALLAPDGLAASRFADTAARMAQVRAALDVATGELARRAVNLEPGGYAWLDAGVLSAAPVEIGQRLLVRLLMAIGGAELPPRLERLERLYAELTGAAPMRGRTLAGCRCMPWRGRVLVCREPAAVAGPLILVPGAAAVWDGRFRVRIGRVASRGLNVAALGSSKLPDGIDPGRVPAPARPPLPALWRGRKLLAVPHLGWLLPGESAGRAGFSAEFAPLRPLPGS